MIEWRKNILTRILPYWIVLMVGTYNLHRIPVNEDTQWQVWFLCFYFIVTFNSFLFYWVVDYKNSALKFLLWVNFAIWTKEFADEVLTENLAGTLSEKIDWIILIVILLFYWRKHKLWQLDT